MPLSSSSSDPKRIGAGASRRSRAPGRPRAAPFLFPRSGLGSAPAVAPPPSSSLAAAPARLRPRRRSSSSRAGEPWGRAAGQRTLCSEHLAGSPSVRRQGPASLKLTTQTAWACSEAHPKAAQHDSRAPNRLEHGRPRRRRRRKAERRRASCSGQPAAQIDQRSSQRALQHQGEHEAKARRKRTRPEKAGHGKAVRGSAPVGREEERGR